MDDAGMMLACMLCIFSFLVHLADRNVRHALQWGVCLLHVDSSSLWQVPRRVCVCSSPPGRVHPQQLFHPVGCPSERFMPPFNHPLFNLFQPWRLFSCPPLSFLLGLRLFELPGAASFSFPARGELQQRQRSGLPSASRGNQDVLVSFVAVLVARYQSRHLPLCVTCWVVLDGAPTYMVARPPFLSDHLKRAARPSCLSAPGVTLKDDRSATIERQLVKKKNSMYKFRQIVPVT